MSAVPKCVLIVLVYFGTHVARISAARVDLKMKSSGTRRFTETRPAAKDTYNFGERWLNLSFDDRWSEFLNAVPLEEFQTSLVTGPVCVPSLHGPKDSPHLVILLHGFTACPGTWDLIKPNLINAEVLSPNGDSSGHGFRVMTPTLPGHGRRFSQEDMDVVEVRELGSQPKGKRHTHHRDDLSSMPSEPTPYHQFAESIGMLAESFKQEHPGGIIALVGYSLGGLIATKVAMDRPKVFDRVMLMNPSFSEGLFVDKISHLLPFLRQSWSECDNLRNTNSGGYCQFDVSNVRAFVDFFGELACNEWDIELCASNILRPNGRKSQADVRQAFRDLPTLQVVLTEDDPTVSNTVIYRLLDEVSKWRPHSGLSTLGSCMWPPEFTHNYIHPRDFPTRDLWWTEYLNAKVEAFLVRGELFPVVDRRGSPTSLPSAQGNVCLPPSKTNLVGKNLKLLPAEQLEEYTVVDANGTLKVVAVKFRGQVHKQSEHLHLMNLREVELAKVGQSIILSTRLERDAGIRDIFEVKAAAKESLCVQVTLAKIDKREALFDQLSTKENDLNLKFCDDSFVDALCAEITCTHAWAPQQEGGYVVSTSDTGAQVAHPIYQGAVLKEGEKLSWMRIREAEVLRFNDDLLLLTRMSPHDAERDFFLIDSSGAAQDGFDDSCVKLNLAKMTFGAPLLEEIARAHGRLEAHKGKHLSFCSDAFVAAICPLLRCGGWA